MQQEVLIVRIEDPTPDETRAAHALVSLELRWISDLWREFAVGRYYAVLQRGDALEIYNATFEAKQVVAGTLVAAGMGHFAPIVFALSTLADVKHYVAQLWTYYTSRSG